MNKKFIAQNNNNDLEYKLEHLYDKIKKLNKLIQTPYNKKSILFSNRLIDDTRHKVVDNLFSFIEELNKPEILDDIMLKLLVQNRYSWNLRNKSFFANRNF